MSLERELEAARDAAQSLAGNGEQVAAVMASEPGLAARVYLIAFGTDGDHSYLALGADLSPVQDHRLVREADWHPTIVSVGHHGTLRRFHEAIVDLGRPPVSHAAAAGN